MRTPRLVQLGIRNMCLSWLGTSAHENSDCWRMPLINCYGSMTIEPVAVAESEG